jgi:hypothetical protein
MIRQIRFARCGQQKDTLKKKKILNKAVRDPDLVLDPKPSIIKQK